MRSFAILAVRAVFRAIGTCVIFLLVAACGGDSPTEPRDVATADPALASVVTTDLTHFWAAYDAGGSSGSQAAFQSLYLDTASTGLRAFVQLRGVSAASLASMVTAYPNYFASIRSNNLGLVTDTTTTARIRVNYRTIKALYPPAVFPPVTLLVGRFGTGGTTSSTGILIGSEFYSIDGTTPLTELGRFQRNNVQPVTMLPVIVAHEHCHVLQARARGLFGRPSRNLLEQSLLEGSADFIGRLSSGGNINAWLWTYALPREAELWTEFEAEMHGSDVSRWLYNQDSTTGDRPGDLGYFIGYRIAESYFDAMSDKAAAVRDIVEVSDADVFLAKSGYHPSLIGAHTAGNRSP